MSAIKIQALIKGYQQRKKYYSTVLELKLHKSIKREKNSNELILKNISQSVSIRKLNLEQCFRAADTDSDGKVSHTELKNFLASLQLSIPPSYISKFLLILDEDCSGIITQEEYYKTLSAFQIGKEQHSASGRGFQHETLIKFSDILKKREIEADELFNLCDIDASGTISLKELERYIMILNIGFQQKEISALMTLLDDSNNGEITRDEFFEHIQRGNKGLFEIEKTRATEGAFINAAPPISIITKFENGKNTLFDILDYFQDILTLDELIKIIKEINKNFNDNDVSSLIKEINKEINKVKVDNYTKTILEDFCISRTETNMLTKKQFIRKLEISLKKNNISIELLVKSENIKGTIGLDKLSMILTKYFNFSQFQIKRFLNLFQIHNFITVEYLQNLITPSDSVEIFSKILSENRLDLSLFFDIIDKKKTGFITNSDFELSAIVEIKNIDERLLTDLVLMFPMPKIDKSTFLRIFQTDQNIANKNNIILAPVINSKLIERSPELNTPSLVRDDSKRKSSLFFLGSDKCADSLRGFISNCEANTPTHTYFEKYGIQLKNLYNIEKFYTLSSQFRIPRVESDDIFRVIDKYGIGFIYVYSFILALDSLRNPLELLPTQENSSASSKSRSILNKIIKKYSTIIPLYKNFPPLSKIVD